MRVEVFIKTYLLCVAIMFIIFTIFDLKLNRAIFLFLAMTFLYPFIFKIGIRLRGIRKGDIVVVSIENKDKYGIFIQKTLAKALSNAKLNEIVEIEINGSRGKAVVKNLGGILMPPIVELLYTEVKK